FLIAERIRHQDRVLALGAGAEQRHRAADQLLDAAHILDAGRRQLGEGAGAARALAPALESLPHRRELALRAHGEGEALDALAVELVADAGLDLLEAVQHVELGERDAVDAVQLHGLAHQHRIEPAAAAAPAGVDAVLVAAVAQQLADAVLELGG